MSLGSEIRYPGFGKHLLRIPDPGVKKVPDPGSGSATLDSTGTYSTAMLLLLRAGGDRSRSNSSYNQEEDISRLVECMALNTTSDEESEASEASTHVLNIKT
jgi:hypothetical protein